MPGYDGYNLNFIKKLWHVIGDNFSKFILDFSKFDMLSHEVNMTWVALIPTFERAFELKDYRLISMVGSIYKVITKLMSKRISMVMPSLIGETQSAFVSGRQILDGDLIANEVVHWVKKRKEKSIMFKLDF